MMSSGLGSKETPQSLADRKTEKCTSKNATIHPGMLNVQTYNKCTLSNYTTLAGRLQIASVNIRNKQVNGASLFTGKQTHRG